MERVFVLDAKRSAIGKFMGTLAGADAADVCAQVIRDGFDRKALDAVESVVIGNVVSAGLGQGVARKIAVQAGIAMRVPAHTVNMVCGSGMQAIIDATNAVRCGAKAVLCGGFEFMSNIPHATRGSLRGGVKRGDMTLIDLMLHDGLSDTFTGVSMGYAAEHVAQVCGITRAMQDEYAYASLQRAIAASDGGIFREEIVPVTVRDAKGRPVTFDTDEHMYRGSTPEKLAALKPAFVENGTVTAGNSAGINDGAAFLLIAGERTCRQLGAQPLAEIVETAAIGCDPDVLGLGPYYAIKALLDKADVPFAQVDCMEVNEAFAAQVLGCYKLLAQDYGETMAEIIARTNIHGSGIGLGHPIGASGARIAVTLAHILRRGPQRLGVATLGIGGGLGTALLLRRVEVGEWD